MIERGKELQDRDSLNLQTQKSTSFIPRDSLIRRLERSQEARARFVESHLNKSIAFQTRSLRARENWTQAQFAAELGVKQNNVSARLENSRYGKQSLSTLKKIAALFDVGLVVWFVPFSRLIDWATETPYLDRGLGEGFYNIPSFDNDPGLAPAVQASWLDVASVESFFPKRDAAPWMQNTMEIFSRLVLELANEQLTSTQEEQPLALGGEPIDHAVAKLPFPPISEGEPVGQDARRA